MAAGFAALGDDDVGAGLDRRPRLSDRADLPAHQRTSVVGDVHPGPVRVAPEEVDEDDPRCSQAHHVDIDVGREEVGRHRPVRALADLIEHLDQVRTGHPRRRQAPDAATLSDGDNEISAGHGTHR